MKEIKINILENCKIDKIENINDVLTITLKEKERKLPKSWEEFCEMYPIKRDETYIFEDSTINSAFGHKRYIDTDRNLLPDRATAEAVLALCQLIQLRNAYNGDWVPDWVDGDHNYVIEFDGGDIDLYDRDTVSSSPLYFKSAELRDEFLRNFRNLIEKLKPLYGIKEGGEECVK